MFVAQLITCITYSNFLRSSEKAKSSDGSEAPCKSSWVQECLLLPRIAGASRILSQLMDQIKPKRLEMKKLYLHFLKHLKRQPAVLALQPSDGWPLWGQLVAFTVKSGDQQWSGEWCVLGLYLCALSGGAMMVIRRGLGALLELQLWPLRLQSPTKEIIQVF